MKEVRRIRKERGLSQQRLAELANVDKVTIVHIETGKVSPNVSTLEKLADALGVQLGEFFPLAQPPLPFGPAPQAKGPDPSEWGLDSERPSPVADPLPGGRAIRVTIREDGDPVTVTVEVSAARALEVLERVGRGEIDAAEGLRELMAEAA